MKREKIGRNLGYEKRRGRRVPFICTGCGEPVPPELRYCSVCERDAGFPNVRRSERKDEKDALIARAQQSRASAEAREATAVFDSFVRVANGSKAIMNRRLTALHSWLVSDSPYFRSFHPQIRDHQLIARDNGWDQQRISAENTINPIYFSELQFAALSLDQRGLSYYGPYCVTLRGKLIEDRATVFEENPFIFNPKHQVFSGREPPLGFRATWSQRGTLAGAKLGYKISKNTTQSEFPAILMGTNRDDADCDFIEVHIYGMLHKRAIERVTGPVPSDQYERAFWDDSKRKLNSLGAAVDEI